MDSRQARLARSLVQHSVREIAAKAGVTPNTISRVENGFDARQSTIKTIRSVYEKMGVRFLSAGDTATSSSVCAEAARD